MLKKMNLVSMKTHTGLTRHLVLDLTWEVLTENINWSVPLCVPNLLVSLFQRISLHKAKTFLIFKHVGINRTTQSLPQLHPSPGNASIGATLHMLLRTERNPDGILNK